MEYFIFILVNIITPIFLQIGAGFALKKFINLNTEPLAKVQFYIFIPVLLFINIYHSELDNTLFATMGLQTVALFFVLYLMGFIGARAGRLDKQGSGAFINSVCFYNSGNYCIPLIQLLYSNPLALSVQMVIMLFQNITANISGVFNCNTGKGSLKFALVQVLKVPMLYSVVLVFIVRGFNIKLWAPVVTALDSLGKGLVPLALVTLGAQLVETKFDFGSLRVYMASAMRLLLSPAAAYLLVSLFGIKGIAAQVAVIAAAAPTAVNALLLSLQYGSEPEFASRSVFLSTVLSLFTMPATIYLVTRFIPA